MDVDNASNMADAQADDRTNSTSDRDDVPDTADAMDASAFEIITQAHTRRFVDSDPTAPNPEQIPSAELESPPEDPDSAPPNLELILSAETETPPENLPNPLELGDSNPHPVVVEVFPRGSPGAPIDGAQGSSIYKLTQEALGGSIWAPFQSECDWGFAHWAKMNGPSSSALTDLLAIPNVRLPFFFLIALLNVV